jgi:hypothetical protein
MNNIMEILHRYIRNNQNVVIEENYNVDRHNECKTEVNRVMLEFLTHVKTYVQIKSVVDSVDTIITNLQNIQLNNVNFALENNNQPQNNPVVELNLPRFENNIYQLLENTYNQLPPSIWQCQYRRSELVQNRDNIHNQFIQSETNLTNIATRLNEHLSRLVKIKNQKVVFDFVANSLNAL